MNITTEAPFQMADSDREEILQRLDDLTTYETRMTQVNVYFKEGDGYKHGGILAEIRVRLPGSDVFAEKTDQDAMTAFRKAHDTIKRQLKKRRDQLNDHQSAVKTINNIVQDNF